jgi:hypothetical protein
LVAATPRILTPEVASFKGGRSIRSSPELDALVEQAQQTINGIQPQTLRDSNRLRQMVARDFEQIQAGVEALAGAVH